MSNVWRGFSELVTLTAIIGSVVAFDSWNGTAEKSAFGPWGDSAYEVRFRVGVPDRQVGGI
jgi:hypothetical protein